MHGTLRLFPVFISPIVWNMCEHLNYESVYFKEVHNDQEYHRPTIYRAGAAVVSTITSLLNSDETIQMYYKIEVIKNQQCVKNTRSSIKQQLQEKFSQDWFKAQNDISDSSRQEYTNKEIKKDYRLEEYLKIVRNPAHRISMTKLRLGVHTLRIQTGKYENKGASIPVEERLCLVCKRNCIEDEKHFLIDFTEYDSLRQKLYFHISDHWPISSNSP